MAIKSITIENFKGIGDAVTIPIRPITLLFGKNSSGKSTVLQALRYLCEKSEDLELEPGLQAKRDLHDAYELLKAVHVLRGHFDPEVLKSIQKDTIKNISNDDLSDFDSQRDKALKSIQKVAGRFESKDDWRSQAETEASERGEIYPGRFTDLGSFSSLVHRQELDRKIRIRLEFDIIPEQLKNLNDILSLAMKSESVTNPKSTWIEMVTGWDAKKPLGYLDLYKYALNGVEWICLTQANRPMPDESKWKYERQFSGLKIYSNPNHPFTFTQAMEGGLSESRLLKEDISWILDTDTGLLNKNTLINIKLWLKECVLEELVENVVKELHDIMLGELHDIIHLGPVRDVPPRNQDSISTSEAEVSRWPIGLEAWDVLMQDPQLLKKTNRSMKNLALGYSIRQSEDSEHEIQLYDETHKICLHPLDVGFGISQVIPVVVGVLDDTSQIFAVEQPELHLHPAAQVALGDVFIDGIKNSNRTMLIETHSEHLLLRIMRRMRETFEDRIEENRFPVTPDDIAVLFVEWHDSQTIIREMPVNERGELVKAWPGGFFEEDIEEVFA